MSQPVTMLTATSSGARRMVSRAWRRRVARHSAQVQGVGVYGMVLSLAGYRPPRCRGERTRQGEWLGDADKFSVFRPEINFGALAAILNDLDAGDLRPAVK